MKPNAKLISKARILTTQPPRLQSTLNLRGFTTRSSAALSRSKPALQRSFFASAKKTNQVEPPKVIPLHILHPLPIRSEFRRVNLKNEDIVVSEGEENKNERVTTKQLEELDIGLNIHKKPENFGDWVALTVVKALRIPADIFFQGKYLHRAVTLETVAAVPGMVAGTLRHLTSLRKMRHDGGWISLLLHEAENERMHLLIWMKATKPTFLERMLVTTVQGVFYNFYFVLYALFPRVAHRTVGYLEEEAVISYTQMIKQLENGTIKNGPAPPIAIEYYGLADSATIRDVALAVRADEANHRDTNHYFAEKIISGDEDLRNALPEKSVQQKISESKRGGRHHPNQTSLPGNVAHQ